MSRVRPWTMAVNDFEMMSVSAGRVVEMHEFVDPGAVKIKVFAVDRADAAKNKAAAAFAFGGATLPGDAAGKEATALIPLEEALALSAAAEATALKEATWELLRAADLASAVSMKSVRTELEAKRGVGP